jgi:hypothetical protein
MSGSILPEAAAAASVAAATTGKYAYQAARAARGLNPSTKMMAAVDLALGSTGVAAGSTAAQDLIAAGTAAKGANSFAKISPVARVVQFAGKAAPVLTRGVGVLGTAYGGFEVGQGINHLTRGENSQGRDKIISGTTGAIASTAVMVAAGAGATGVGAPVAAIALGVAAGASAIKYGWEYREQIGDFARDTGRAIGRGWDRLTDVFQ